MNIIEHIQINIQKRITEIEALKNLLKTIPEDGFEIEKSHLSFSGNMIDINGPSRKDVEKTLMFLRAGKWEKEKHYDGEKIDYTSINEIVPGFRLRMWGADPPGTCRVIEEEVEIPAQPARIEKRKRIVCKEFQTPETPIIESVTT